MLVCWCFEVSEGDEDGNVGLTGVLGRVSVGVPGREAEGERGETEGLTYWLDLKCQQKKTSTLAF